MSNEDATKIDEEPKLLVSNFERDERVLRSWRIQVPVCSQTIVISRGMLSRNKARGAHTVNSREVRQKVDDRLARVDVVIDTRHFLGRTRATQNRDPRKRQSRRPDDLFRPVGAVLIVVL